MVLKRIGVLSMAKMAAVLYAVMGLVGGLMFATVFSLIGFAGPTTDPDFPAWLAPMFGIGSIVILPIVYGVIGAIAGTIGALVYNAFAGMVGGIELHLEPAARP
jgi:hypothetical protein